MIPALSAQTVDDIEYLVIIEDNGNVVVLITINGIGLFEIPIQEDVQSVDIEGGLYLIEDGTLEVVIGSTEKAVIVYQTSMLTSKNDGVWNFDINLINIGYEKTITVAMPANTVVTNTNPQGKIESGEIMKISWDNTENVFIEYYFQAVDETTDLRPLCVILIGALALIAGYYLTTRRKKSANLSKKESIIETLSENEKKIVKILMDNDGRIKRSKLERTSEISKSSLAASLKNLERKKILEVDRTYASHYVKFTEWFNGL